MELWLGAGDAYGLLAELVKTEYGLSPLPETAREESGKPFFPGFRALHFNLSHSGTLALCALSAGIYLFRGREFDILVHIGDCMVVKDRDLSSIPDHLSCLLCKLPVEGSLSQRACNHEYSHHLAFSL